MNEQRGDYINIGSMINVVVEKIDHLTEKVETNNLSMIDKLGELKDRCSMISGDYNTRLTVIETTNTVLEKQARKYKKIIYAGIVLVLLVGGGGITININKIQHILKLLFK